MILSGCPTCGARSASHPIVEEHEMGLIRLCPCGGTLGYDSGIFDGPEIEASPERVAALKRLRDGN